MNLQTALRCHTRLTRQLSNVAAWNTCAETRKPSQLVPLNCCVASHCLHTGAVHNAWANEGNPKKWLDYNRKIFPPQLPEEERRPAYVCHQKTNIKYSPWKMWYIASMVRGMSVDEAVKQLSFVLKKGSAYVKDAILEAQEMAVTRHNVEFRSNLWVAESFVGKGKVIKGVRRHARARVGQVEYFHCHYFVRLEEGPPPANYYPQAPKTGDEMLTDWLQQMRDRKITSSL